MKLFFHSFAHPNNKKGKRLSFVPLCITTTKQKNSMKQDLSFFHALQQQNRKINKVFFHPIIVAQKKKLLFVS